MASAEKKTNKITPYQEIASLKKKLRLLRTIIALLICIIGTGAFLYIRGTQWENAVSEPQPLPQPPAAAEIKRIIAPLSYSGLQNLLNADVTVTADFDRQAWTIHNIYRFDEQGRIKLSDNKYGLCGDLAAYVNDKTRPLLGTQFDFFFLHVAESGFSLIPGHPI